MENTPLFEESTIIEMLANSRRRIFLEALASYDDPVPLNQLVTDIMRLEDEEWDDSSKYRNSVRVSLRQNHLEVLEANGLITYDTAADRIIHGEEFHRVETVLRSLEGATSMDRSSTDRSDSSHEFVYSERTDSESQSTTDEPALSEGSPQSDGLRFSNRLLLILCCALTATIVVLLLYILI
ncbi:DUF7344 domain-containing protein [Halostagnicola kamekurae]|uniref:DUF7344 domain-containing protein n=1 Tax=Halostagnicola kamekurae TaxID=619731 RepID=A0A1I6TQM4_9EURY|nr:hypothetical protein [Halostagnicola kamekurae]SFS91428.1 hypothetical protein SAMN04488556_3315 [Halostagnicola kamekurae]